MAFLNRLAGLALSLSLLFAQPVWAANGGALHLQEQKIKAGLLYNFLKYVEWPTASIAGSSSMQVCIFGKDPFGGQLEPLSGRSVNQRQITLRQVSAVSDTQNCHLLFINAGEQSQWPRLRDSLNGKSVLTVSDFASFTPSGGMIGFNRKNERIGVEVNVEALDRAQLRIQDRLLKLANVVHQASRTEGR